MKSKSKTKLEWKLNWCDDKSGCWYSAKVPVIGWVYNIEVEGWYDYENEEFVERSEYIPGVFYNNLEYDCSPITKKEFYKKLDAAKAACEKHLKDNAEKFNKWLKTK
jgi:hypothetical protein